MLWFERKWIDMISPKLERFKWLDDSTANFRCPVCGDSESNERKARAYFIVHKNKYFFKCHNCGISLGLSAFLKKQFPERYSEYQLELMKEKNSSTPSSKKKIEAQQQNASTSIQEKLKNSKNNDWTYLNELKEDHPARKYIENRNLPSSSLSELIYTNDFCDWIVENSGLKKYARRLPHDRRILIPLINEKQKLIGVQGRIIGETNKKTLRYITIKFDQNAPKLYGLHKLQKDKPIFVVEGPLDSLFLPNSIALCGGDVSMSLSSLPKDQIYVILDNEPRSKETIERMQDAIDQGYRVMFWNEMSSEFKDINDMISKGKYQIKDLLKQIHQNSKQGMAANLTLSMWKRI